MFKKIEEQESILSSRNESLTVCASAGSGKTSVMIRRLVSLIIDEKISVLDVLVLTYTNAAATEMKERLIKQLKQSGDNEVFSQLDNVSVADISTIHSFCEKLIKKYSFLLGIDSNFKLMSEALSSLYMNRAAKEAFEKLSFEEKLKLLTKYKRQPKKIFDIVIGIHNYANASLDHSFLEKETDYDLAYQILNDKLLNGVKYYKTVFEKLLIKTQSKLYHKYINEILSGLYSLSSEFSFIYNYNRFINLSFATLSKDKEENDEFYEQLKVAKKDLACYISSYKKKELGNFEIEESAKRENLPGLFIKLYKMFCNVYSKKKERDNYLDFSDLEKITLKLLENENVKREIKNSYKYVFIDEYQDANRVQEKLIKGISSDNNLFVVGDPKQGIYGFRNACPDIIMEEMLSPVSTNKFLKCNFRSDAKILHFVNSVFSGVMTNETCGLDYKETSMIIPMAEYPEDGHAKVKIDINLKKEKAVEAPQGKYSLKDEDTPYNFAEKEADIAAYEISKIIGTKIYDKDMGGMREVSYSDITILLRKRGDYLDAFSSRLSSLGIPVITDSREELIKDPIITTIFNLIKLAYNMEDDIALVSVMLSPFGDFTTEELVTLRKESEAEFYNAVLNSDNDKVLKFKVFIQNFKAKLISTGIASAVEFALIKKSYREYVLMNYGEGKLVKIELFLENIKTSGYNYNLYKLIEFIQDAEEKTFTSVSAKTDSVNITTIHASKGLEYPIVILANAGENFTKGMQSAEFKINNKIGLCLKYYDEQTETKYSLTAYEAAKVLNREDEFSEKLRVLYVALTRAKNKLYIIGSISKKYEDFYQHDYEIRKVQSYLELLIKNPNLDKNYFELEYFEEQDFVDSKPQVSLSYERNEKLIYEIKKYLDFKYPFMDESRKLSKTSVTNILNNFEGNPYENKDKIDEGILYHELLRDLDFSKILSISDLSLDEKYGFINKENLFKNIKIIDNLTKGKIVKKEQKFMLESGGSLVQGIVDLIALGDKNIIIDYKYTNIEDDSVLLSKYAPQLKLYEKAILSAFNIDNTEKYILSLKKNKLIKIN